MIELPTKTTIRDELIAHLTRELDAAVAAHATTMRGATHEEARPENDKDTRALEQSYLARGQALRVAELESALVEIRAMPIASAHEGSRVAVGGLVRADDDGEERAYFVALHGGGAKLCQGAVQVVTPQSPLGRALIGKSIGDELEVVLPRGKRTLEITRID